MTDKLISLQAALEAIEGWKALCKYYHPNSKNKNIPVEEVIQILKDLPEAVIRCRDCEYGAQDEDGSWYCRGIGASIGELDGTGFCADAERRE